VRRASICFVGRDRLRDLDRRSDRPSDVTRVVVGYWALPSCSARLYWLSPRQPLEARRHRLPGSTEEMELQLASGDEAG
jgi:hypothetical protein